MDKAAIISLVKSYYQFSDPVIIKTDEEKYRVTSLQVVGESVRVYYDYGHGFCYNKITEWDYCDDFIRDEIIKHLKTLQ